MILQCGHCGAPLDVEARHTVFTCRYCKTKNERQRVRTIADTTPKDFEPPKVWRPPAEFPADSATELKYQPNKGGGCVVVGILGVVLIGIAIAIFGGLGGFDTGESTIAKLELNRTVKQLDDDADGKPSDDALYVTMRSSRFKSVNFAWDHGHPDHVQSVTFVGKAADPALVAALSKNIPNGLDASGDWRWNDASLAYNHEAGILYCSVRVENPLWKEQMDALWKVIVLSVFGKGAPLGPQEAHMLGAAYPFGDLAKLAPATTVDRSQAETQKIFPSVIKEYDNLIVALDHPLFMQVQLEWYNQRGATLHGVRLKARGGDQGFAPHRKAFVSCLSKTYYAPMVSDSDFMKKKENYQFRIGNSVTLWIYEGEITVDTEKIEPAAWKTLIDSIAGCKD